MAKRRSRKTKRASKREEDTVFGRVERIADRGDWALDFYHHLLMVSPWTLFLILVATYIGFNLLFGALYVLQPGGIANAAPGSFPDAFFFSVQTMATIGYGDMHPATLYTNLLVTAEVLLGMTGLALATGLVFARFSRPTARVMFSRVAVVTLHDGVPTLMFRAANQRGNQILNAEVSVSLARQMTSQEGIVMRRFQELKLVRSRSPLFALSWTVMHPIDELSPLYGATPDSLYEDQAEIIVLLSGRDDTLSDIIYARHSYMPDEILWNRRFVDVLEETPSGRRLLNLRCFHETEPLRD